MLKPDEAQKYLEKLRNKQWIQTRLPSLKKLPAKLRSVARPLSGHKEDGKELRWEEHEKLRTELAPILQATTAKERVSLFEALLPGLGQAMENGWQLFDRLPYCKGGGDSDYGKPYRLPGSNDVLLLPRMRWVEAIVDLIGSLPSQDLTWHAAWGAHYAFYTSADDLGILLAAAIDAGGKTGDEVFQTLCSSALGEHETGAMGRHIVRALLCASREDGWEFIEKMLLAAQREEGLRQSILETVDAAHPKAFVRMLRLIKAQNLSRFSATVRALDVWLGYAWDSVSTGVVNQTIENLTLYLEDEKARAAALKGKDAEQAYLALWTTAFDNVGEAIEPAVALLKHPKPEFRFIAAHFLGQTNLVEAEEKVVPFLRLEDPHLLYSFLSGGRRYSVNDRLANSDLFERLEKMLQDFPAKPLQLNPVVWPWTGYKLQRAHVSAALFSSLGKRPVARLVAHFPILEASERYQTLLLLIKENKEDAINRKVFLQHVGDSSADVRRVALEGLEKGKLKPEEAPELEGLLSRNAGDLRRGIIGLLLKLPDVAALASVDRLLEAKSAPQRLAGLELLRQLTEGQRCFAEAGERAASYRARHPELADAEKQQLETIETPQAEALTLDNALGLIRHEDRTWPEKPVNRKTILHSPAAIRIIQELDELIHQHRERRVEIERWGGDKTETLLGEMSYWFVDPKATLSREEDLARLPLADVWEKWYAGRGKELQDSDGFEFFRAWVHCAATASEHRAAFNKRCTAEVKLMLGDYPAKRLRYGHIVKSLLLWLIRLHPPAGSATFLLDAVETVFSVVPDAELRYIPKEDNYLDADWRDDESPFMQWKEIASLHRQYVASAWKSEHHVRCYRLMRWCDQPFGVEKVLVKGKVIGRNRASLEELLEVFNAGGATSADVIEHLLGPPESGYYYSSRFQALSRLTTRKRDELLHKFPAVLPLVEKCRARILEVELTRGDTPTIASKAALDFRSIHGIPNVMAVLRALGTRNFTRGWARDNESKETVFSHLTRCSFPLESETVEDFKKQTLEARIPEQRLVELAVYAPQWATYVEHALGWKSLTEGVWWIHAHTRGTDWTVDREIREMWEADMSQRTSLTSADLLEGAVDVAWFLRVYAELGPKRWIMLDDAAKYASTGGGHTRARLFAEAMLGKVKKKELLTRINVKRHQDSVRALGLLPLAGKARENDLLERYKTMQEFIRTSKQFGSQRQASEKRAAQIGQENLARTAGYADPLRLQWAMEARAVADLADGPISVTIEGVTVSLGIDPWGDIEFNVTKDGRTLADIPPKLKKEKKISALRERRTELKRQAARIRGALEQFMCRGDIVTGAEMQELMKHPLLAPMLRGLILVGDGVIGYPINDGKVLEDYEGNKEALKKDEKIRIAHPHDLLPAAKWTAWQKDCFAKERIQPFKQVFRELYTITKTEKLEKVQSLRYAGHQVQPRQTLALLSARGWVHHAEEGVRKTFHDAGVTAWLEFDETFFTPAEIEGLTVDSVRFTNRADGKPLKLIDLPPRLFSEVMRDLDLVVSVAHRGGIDPEASVSTIEMRTALVKETSALLKLTNVRVKDNFVLIKGDLGEYSVHLGSAVTRKNPGATLFIVAVHAQHRGRLFLPFADNDPRTAEVMSKVLLLARDNEIKDPSILDQIRGR